MTWSPQYRGSHSPPSSVSSQLESVLGLDAEVEVAAEEERYAANDIGEMSVGFNVGAETCPAWCRSRRKWQIRSDVILYVVVSRG